MCEETSIFRYLCPSLLSEKDILAELKTKCPKIKGLEQKSREELTQLFTKHLVPLPQRKFPDSHRGTLINKMIEKESQSCRFAITQEKSSLQYGFSDKRHDSNLPFGPTSRGVLPTTGDRLKPPIDSGDLQSRKISLSKTQPSGSSLDRVVIKDRSKERNESTSSESSRRSSTEDSKKVNLKRSNSTSEDPEDISPSKKARARERIAWP